MALAGQLGQSKHQEVNSNTKSSHAKFYVNCIGGTNVMVQIQRELHRYPNTDCLHETISPRNTPKVVHVLHMWWGV